MFSFLKIYYIQFLSLVKLLVLLTQCEFTGLIVNASRQTSADSDSSQSSSPSWYRPSVRGNLSDSNLLNLISTTAKPRTFSVYDMIDTMITKSNIDNNSESEVIFLTTQIYKNIGEKLGESLAHTLINDKTVLKESNIKFRIPKNYISVCENQNFNGKFDAAAIFKNAFIRMRVNSDPVFEDAIIASNSNEDGLVWWKTGDSSNLFDVIESGISNRFDKNYNQQIRRFSEEILWKQILKINDISLTLPKVLLSRNQLSSKLVNILLTSMKNSFIKEIPKILYKIIVLPSDGTEAKSVNTLGLEAKSVETLPNGIDAKSVDTLPNGIEAKSVETLPNGIQLDNLDHKNKENRNPNRIASFLQKRLSEQTNSMPNNDIMIALHQNLKPEPHEYPRTFKTYVYGIKDIFGLCKTETPNFRIHGGNTNFCDEIFQHLVYKGRKYIENVISSELESNEKIGQLIDFDKLFNHQVKLSLVFKNPISLVFGPGPVTRDVDLSYDMNNDTGIIKKRNKQYDMVNMIIKKSLRKNSIQKGQKLNPKLQHLLELIAFEKSTHIAEVKSDQYWKGLKKDVSQFLKEYDITGSDKGLKHIEFYERYERISRSSCGYNSGSEPSDSENLIKIQNLRDFATTNIDDVNDTNNRVQQQVIDNQELLDKAVNSALLIEYLYMMKAYLMNSKDIGRVVDIKTSNSMLIHKDSDFMRTLKTEEINYTKIRDEYMKTYNSQIAKLIEERNKKLNEVIVTFKVTRQVVDELLEIEEMEEEEEEEEDEEESEESGSITQWLNNVKDRSVSWFQNILDFTQTRQTDSESTVKPELTKSSGRHSIKNIALSPPKTEPNLIYNPFRTRILSADSPKPSLTLTNMTMSNSSGPSNHGYVQAQHVGVPVNHGSTIALPFHLNPIPGPNGFSNYDIKQSLVPTPLSLAPPIQNQVPIQAPKAFQMKHGKHGGSYGLGGGGPQKY